MKTLYYSDGTFATTLDSIKLILKLATNTVYEACKLGTTISEEERNKYIDGLLEAIGLRED